MQWKYPKKELLWSQLLLFFHLLKHYAVSQWCISWKQWQISNREIKLAVFPVLICSDQSEKTMALSFFARKLLKTCLGGFSVGFWCWPTVYSFEIWDTRRIALVVDYFCHFECQFLHNHHQDNFFVVFSCFSQKNV